MLKAKLLVPKDQLSRKLVEWAASEEGKKRIAADAKVANEFIDEFKRRRTRIRKY
jgi:hypothetical protein